MYGSVLNHFDNLLKLDNFFFLPSSHVVCVAGSTETPSIVLFVRVHTLGGIVLSAVQIITVIAHALRVVLPVVMRTVRDFHQLSILKYFTSLEDL